MQFGHSKDWRRRGPNQSGTWEQRSSREGQRSSSGSSSRWQSHHDRSRDDWSSSNYRSERERHSNSRSERDRHSYSRSTHSSHPSRDRSSRSTWSSGWSVHRLSKADDSEATEGGFQALETSSSLSSIRSPPNLTCVSPSPTKCTDFGYHQAESYGCSFSTGNVDQQEQNPAWISIPSAPAAPLDFQSFSPPTQPSIDLIKSIPSSVIRDPRLFSRLKKIVQPEATATTASPAARLFSEAGSSPRTSATQSVIAMETPPLLLIPKVEPGEILEDCSSKDNANIVESNGSLTLSTQKDSSDVSESKNGCDIIKTESISFIAAPESSNVLAREAPISAFEDGSNILTKTDDFDISAAEEGSDVLPKNVMIYELEIGSNILATSDYSGSSQSKEGSDLLETTDDATVSALEDASNVLETKDTSVSDSKESSNILASTDDFTVPPSEESLTISSVSAEDLTVALGEVISNKPAVDEIPAKITLLDSTSIKQEIVETGSVPEVPAILERNLLKSSDPSSPPTKTEKVPSPQPMPQLKMHSIVKESFLKLKLEGRAKMTAPSKGDSKQSQALLKLVIGSEVASSKSGSELLRPINVHNMSKFAGLKTILNSVMKTSISQVLRTKLDSRCDAARPELVEESKPKVAGGFVCPTNASQTEGNLEGVITRRRSEQAIMSKDIKLKVEVEDTSPMVPVRARKSIPPVKDTASVKKSSPKSSSTGKKQRKRFFKGATYNLYFSSKKKKKKLRDDESSITGTETTGSFMDSEDEADSSISEECRSVSDTSSSKVAAESRNVDEETGSVSLVGNLNPVGIKQEIEDQQDDKQDVNGDAKESTEEPNVLKHPEEGIVTRRVRERQLLEAVRFLDKENVSGKEGAQSIASSVKQRQRLKRRYIEDQVDMDAVSIASSEGSSSLAKRARRMTMHAMITEETQVSTELSEITNGFIPNVETLYSSKLPPIVNCSCLEKPLDASSEELSDDAKIYCQAIDSIGQKLIGCCNIVTTKQLVRPSMRIPFAAMCEVHFWRLRHHQCCPTCGLFCSEGKFLQCRTTFRERVQIHLFHKHCKIVQENGLTICPHCSSAEKIKEITLELNLPNAPTFYLTQKPVFVEPKARMTFSRLVVAPEVEEIPAETVTTLDSGKVLSSAGLPVGPCRTELESLLEKLKTEKLDASKYCVGDLYKAAKCGDLENVAKMLVLEFDPNLKLEGNGKQTPLHAAANEGHLSTAHLLIQASASLDHVDAHLYTPLMYAVEKKNVAIVQYLIKAGAQLDIKGEDGMCGLHLAARGGNLEMCKAFLNTGRVNTNIQDDGGWTPIVWASEFRHLSIVKLLIERGADPNIRDNELNNALHWSAFSGNVEISQLFLDLGLKLTDVNEHGDTPLHIAARQNNYECVILFLARGARIDARNKESQMPIKCCLDPQSETGMALTMNYELKRFAANRPLRAERIIYRDISRGKETNPIQCVNGVDDELWPTDFLYIIENCETSPISIDRTITSLQSCQCEDDCTSSSCTCATISFKCWYDNDGRLLPEFNLPDPPMIFECNRACLCWKNCNNRALQHGMPSRLQLFKTKGKGWGVRTLKDIPKGTFVCEYIGEIISDSEADQREDDSYLFDLDNRDGETYCLDARYYGNISRFINHLCDPNLVPVKIFVEHQDLSFPRIAFFSSRDIKADEELGFDYGEKFWVIKYKWFTCTCGAAKCKYSEETIHETLENFRLAKDQHTEEVQKGAW